MTFFSTGLVAECLHAIYSVTPATSVKRSHKSQELDEAQPNRSGLPNPGTSDIWMKKKARMSMGEYSLYFKFAL